MIRLEEITRFKPVRSGGKLVLDHDKRRLVRLEVNTEGPTRLEYEDGGEIRFLAIVHGRETLTFIADGPCAIRADNLGDEGDEIWWFTSEMETTSIKVPDAATFTRLPERNAISPEMEAIRRYVREGELRREQALKFEIDRLRAENGAARDNRAPVDAEPAQSPASDAETDPGATADRVDDSGGQGDGTGA